MDKNGHKRKKREKRLKRSILTNMIIVPFIPFLLAMGVSFYFFTTALENKKVNSLKSSFRRVSFTFGGKVYTYQPLTIYLICSFVGIIGGIYGIGGGSIIAPVLVTIIGLPVHVIAGAALLGTFVTSVSGVIFYQLLSFVYPQVAVSPDWMLGALFGSGGILGMYLGARVQKYVQPVYIKGILSCCILFVALKYISAFFV